MAQPTITLVNHACVKIAIGDLVVLCDPWIDGPAFNFGWDLLIETPMTMAEVMQDVTHIWVSHEHPDHFAPKFFADIADFASRIPVLFQKTRDKRVRDFLQGRGFQVIELADRERQQIGRVAVTCGTQGFYDSWLHLAGATGSVLNLNDCGYSREPELQELARSVGPVDVLLTQFSYAAWKGTRTDVAPRASAARRKLNTIVTQTRTLSARHVIPFASFVYFSSTENSYLNDAMNTPADAAGAIRAAGAEPVILFPGDRWSLGDAHDPARALAAYQPHYDRQDTLARRDPGPSVPLPELTRQFADYQRGVFARNSRMLMRLLRHVPSLDVFGPVRIRLTDLETTISVSVFDGLRATQDAHDVAMHSSSLSFLFRNLFGFDTLVVNGRFEATPEGFAKLTRSLGIGSLNAMGLSVSPGIFLELPLVAKLLDWPVSYTRPLTKRAAAGG